MTSWPYHVSLGGQGFLLDPSTYTVRAQAEVAGPAAVEAGSRVPALDPFVERVQRQTRFGRGEGIERFADPGAPDGWRAGSGVQPTPSGGLTLGPLLADAGGGPVFGQGVQAFAPFRGRLYAGLASAPGEVWAFDPTSGWSLAFTTSKPGVRSLAVYKDALYVGNGGDGTVQVWDGAALATAWTNPAVSAIPALAVAWFGGAARLYLGNCQTSGGGWIQSFDGVAQSTLAVLEEPRVEALAALDGRLFVCASDGAGSHARGALYSYAGSASGFGLERAFADGYAAAATSLDHRLYLGWSRGGRVLAWEQASRTLTDLPQPGPPADQPALALAAFEQALWVGTRDATAGTLSLRRYDPATGGWSTPGSSSNVADASLALGVFGSALYLGSQSAAGGARVLRAEPAVRALAGEVETPPFDGGLSDAARAPRAALLRHAPLPTGASIAVDYQPAAGAPWQALGTVSTASSQDSSLPFPAGVTATVVRLRLRLARGPGAADAPVVEELALRSVLVPPTRREWSFQVLLQGDAARPLLRLDHTPDPRTARQMADALWTLRAAAGPLTFVDLEGITRQVWLRELKETPQKALARDPAATWTLAQVTLVEA